jgi:tetratricopeptide (TPR) repeat protein
LSKSRQSPAEASSSQQLPQHRVEWVLSTILQAQPKRSMDFAQTGDYSPCIRIRKFTALPPGEKYKERIMDDVNSAESLYLEGVTELENDNASGAIQKFKEALKIDPAHGMIYEKWAEAAKLLPLPGTELDALRKAIESDYPTAHGYNSLGNMLYTLNQFEGAKQVYLKGIDIDASQVYLHINCGMAHYQLAEYESAIECYREADLLEPGNDETLRKWGLVLEDQKEYSAAKEKYLESQTRNIGNEQTYKGWSSILEHLPDPENEIREFREVIESDFANVTGYSILGDTYKNLGQYDAAIECYREVLKIDPLHEDAYDGWARSIGKLPDPREETEALQNAIQADFPTEGGYGTLGSLYYDLKDYEKSVQSYQAAIGINSSKSYLHTNLGLAYGELNQPDKAIESYQQSISIDPLSHVEYNYYGWELHKKGDYAEALIKFKEAIKIDPGYKIAYENWARTITHLAEPDSELEAFVTSIDTNYQGAEGLTVLGLLYQNLGRYKDSVDTYKQAIKENSSIDYIHVHLGLVHDRFGQFKKAIKAYKRAIDLNPEYEIPYVNWGVTLEDQQDFAGALQKYKKALELKPDDELVYSNIGLIIDKLPEPEAELKWFRLAIEADYPTAQGYKSLANAMGQCSHYEEARRYYLKSIQLDPKFAEAYQDLANNLDEMLRFEEAIENFERAIELKDDPYHHHNLASTLQDLGRYEESRRSWVEAFKSYRHNQQTRDNWTSSWFFINYAVACSGVFKDFEYSEKKLKRASRLNPGNYYVHFVMAKLYLEEKENAISDSKQDRSKRNLMNFKSWEAYRKVEEILFSKKSEISSDSTLLDLTGMYISFGKYEIAKQYVDKVLEKRPDHIMANINAGVIYLNQDHFKRAIRCFRNALSRNQDNLEARSKLAFVFQKQGNSDEAEAEYQKVFPGKSIDPAGILKRVSP